MTDATTTPEFTITRTLDAPRELVWRAWTEPEQLVQWLHPLGCTTPRESLAFDVRKGGKYTYTMVVDDTGDKYQTGGEFLEVVPPERLVFTWGIPENPTVKDPVATVTFTSEGTKTRMEFHLRGVESQPGEDGVYDGWNETLEILATYVKSQNK